MALAAGLVDLYNLSFVELGLSPQYMGLLYAAGSVAGAVTEYTGAASWADANISAMCGSVIAGSSASGAGYSSGDTATGPWRSWTGA